MPQEQRLRKLLAIFRASALYTELAGLPSELLLSCAVLRYLLSEAQPSDEVLRSVKPYHHLTLRYNQFLQNEGDEDDDLARAEPLLYEWEFEAYLVHLLKLQRNRTPVVLDALYA